MSDILSDKQWEFYNQNGYLRLGKLLDGADLAKVQGRIDDIMLGKATLDYSRLMMQLDSETGKYNDAGEQSRGHKGATLNYRKIQDLELDPVFLEYMQRPIFREICRRVYGGETPIATFRAMFMNKPAHKGTFLPWHQDRWSYLDREAQVTIYTALDPATKANGCVQIIPGSHKMGVINPSNPSGFLTEEQAAKFNRPEQIHFLELEAGEVALLHNLTLHASDVNRSDVSRRAFSVCYMDARTVANNGESFPVIFGKGSVEPQAA